MLKYDVMFSVYYVKDCLISCAFLLSGLSTTSLFNWSEYASIKTEVQKCITRGVLILI